MLWLFFYLFEMRKLREKLLQLRALQKTYIARILIIIFADVINYFNYLILILLLKNLFHYWKKFLYLSNKIFVINA